MTLDFAFDFISPYAWFAWHDIHALAERHHVDLRPIPVLFAAMLKTHGQLGPAEIPSKRVFTFQNCLRTARRKNIPFTAPPAHPFNPLLALRVASLPEATFPLINDLFREVWAGGRGVTDPQVVDEIAARHGIPNASGRAAEAKATVRQNTEIAIQRGAFGVPTIWVGDDMFWGHDSFANLEHRLNGHVLDASEWERFRDLPAQAIRPR